MRPPPPPRKIMQLIQAQPGYRMAVLDFYSQDEPYVRMCPIVGWALVQTEDDLDNDQHVEPVVFNEGSMNVGQTQYTSDMVLAEGQSVEVASYSNDDGSKHYYLEGPLDAAPEEGASS